MPTDAVPARSPLKPGVFTPLPLGSVRPRGWLLDQCRVQAAGLTGHLESAWPDLGPGNMWLGGPTEGWERGPYYLDGLVPLAHVLQDEALTARAQRWIDSILGMQSSDGWIGPVQAPGRAPYDQWPVFIVLKVLTQHHEATGDPRVVPAMTRFCAYLRDTLAERPLRDWGLHRWADAVLSIHWLYNRTGERWLLDVSRRIAEQGYNWRRHFDEFAFTGKTPREACVLHTHVVNNAMAAKTCGVWWRQSGARSDKEAVYSTLEMLDAYHGCATGIFTGDEHYAGRDPRQGTELCAVVEMMYSLEELLPILGDADFADRLERIAYNALPGTFTADMWAHQYDQQANQVLCTIAPRQWTNNDDTSNIYGLEPNYGCCTANYHQGWPKLVRSLWMATADAGLAAVAYGPCAVTASVGDGCSVTIVEDTEYPFRETVRFRIDCDRPVRFPLVLRIPWWCVSATVALPAHQPAPAGDEPIQAGEWLHLEREWRPGDEVELRMPMDVRIERRGGGAVVVHRGPLVFALRVSERFRLIAGVERPAPGERSPDYEVIPTSPWNYALVVDSEEEEIDEIEYLGGCSVEEAPVPPIPFDHGAPPIVLKVRARRVPGWEIADNSAGPTPESPAETDKPERIVELVPYGSTCLRITEFPEAPPED